MAVRSSEGPTGPRATGDDYNIRVQLLLCVGIPGSVVSANRFSSRVVRCLLLCVSITTHPASAFVFACQPNSVLVEKADAC